MNNSRKACSTGNGMRRVATGHSLNSKDAPVSFDETLMLDAPGQTLQTRYAILTTRYCMSLCVVPYVSQYLTNPLDMAAIVDEAVRRLREQYRFAGMADYSVFLRTYTNDVETAIHPHRSRAKVAQAWAEHAADLRRRWGNALEALHYEP